MSLDRVPGPAEIYIGGLISMKRYEALKKANITHVVTALRQPVDPALYANYQHLVVELDDVDDEDIVQHFAMTNAFIQAGLDGGGGVLVHCMMGISRSATIVIAYLMSRDPTLTPTAALKSLRDTRQIANPNEGFMRQLELYHSMGCPVDVLVEPKYQRWLYQREVDMSVACGQAPDHIRFEDEATPASEPSSENSQLEIRCRRCRQVLASSQYIVPHTPKPPSATQAARITASLDNVSTARPSAQAKCAHIFVDPLSWMRGELERGRLDGKLNCPNTKCNAVLGKYAWQGQCCSCGKWVVPAISLTRARVDEVRPVALLVGKGKM